MFADSYVADATQFDALCEPSCEVASITQRGLAGIDGLRPVDRSLLVEYEREMDVVIPQIVEAVQRREALAHEARQRGPLFARELQPGECGGTSCPPEYESRFDVFEGWALPRAREGNGSGFGFDSGGGRHVIKSTKSFS